MTALKRRATDAAYDIAERLREPAELAEGSSLWRGHPGIAVLYAAMSAHDSSWAAVTHTHLTAAGSLTLTGDAAADLVPAALIHHRAHGGYEGLLRQAGTALVVLCRSRVAAQRRGWQKDGPGVAMSDYDVVSGLAGQGRILLSLAEHGLDVCAEALAAVLCHLVTITEPIMVRGREVPGWWCGPRHYTEALDKTLYPDGDFNLGLAHGIAGPLALLAIAHDRGYRVEGMERAMRRIVDWLLGGRFADEHGPLWPHRIGLADQLAGRVEPGPTRAAWCYGTAGVAHALNLAGHALDDTEAISVAGSALRGVFRRPWRRANLNDTALCHGMAGLLQIVRHTTNADVLVRKIVEGGPPAGKAGLLEGAAGVALALASYAGMCAEWDSVLLLS
jgi:hypothetical protein